MNWVDGVCIGWTCRASHNGTSDGSWTDLPAIIRSFSSRKRRKGLIMHIRKPVRIPYLFFLVFFFARAGEVFGLEKFYYGSSTKGASNAYAFMGIERDIFVKEGVEFTPLYMGIPPALAALVSGDVHGISYNPARPCPRARNWARTATLSTC